MIEPSVPGVLTRPSAAKPATGAPAEKGLPASSSGAALARLAQTFKEACDSSAELSLQDGAKRQQVRAQTDLISRQ